MVEHNIGNLPYHPYTLGVFCRLQVSFFYNSSARCPCQWVTCLRAQCPWVMASQVCSPYRRCTGLSWEVQSGQQHSLTCWIALLLAIGIVNLDLRILAVLN